MTLKGNYCIEIQTAIKDLNLKFIFKHFKNDKIKNANIIIDILQELENKDNTRIKKSVAILNKIFINLLKDGDLKIHKNIAENVMSAKVKYDIWLYDRYEDFQEQLFKLLNHSDDQMQKLSLCVIVKLMQMEVNHPLTKEKICNNLFPLTRLKNLLVVLLSESCNKCLLIRQLKEYLEYPDFLIPFLSVLNEIVNAKKSAKDNSIYIRNLFTLLEMINLPFEGNKFTLSKTLFKNCGKGEINNPSAENGMTEIPFPYAEGQAYFNAIWEIFLNFELTSDIYKRCLILIPEKVIIHLERPVRLTDFFLNAYNLGGSLSMLALQGVFVLVNQYNLDYPEFYDKVYGLLEPTIFQAKYKPRFFMLCEKFLTSTLLPEYIVAAFIKRMSRLMLVAPSPSIILLLKFVANLLLAYPSLRRMINSPNATSLDVDPYIEDEPQTKLCRAGESSLWEVATMRYHSLCGISKAANFIYRNLPDVEHNLGKFVEENYEELLGKANKIQEPRVFTNIYEPEALFSYPDDDMSTSWVIE